MNLNHVDTSSVLLEAMPYIQRFHGKTLVVKMGGNAMTDFGFGQTIMEDRIHIEVRELIQ